MLGDDPFRISDYLRRLDAERRGEGDERRPLVIELGLARLAPPAVERAFQLADKRLGVLDPLADPRLDGVAEAVGAQFEVVAGTVADRFTVDLRPVPFGVGEETEDGLIGRPDHSPIRSLLISERTSISIPSR